MNSAKILAVDADKNIRAVLSERLKQAGHLVIEASNASSALSKLRSDPADLVVLDDTLPDLRGLDVLREIKQNDYIGPLRVVMTSSSSDEAMVVRALENGADDYLAKPYSIREIVARIQLGLRRAPVPYLNSQTLVAGNITIDQLRHEVRIDKLIIDLSPLEYRLLYFFATNQDRMFTRAELIKNAWKNGTAVGERTVDVNIRRLRQQISHKNCDKYIQTVRSNGYRFSI